ncbi:DUF222 domain-containing protein [Kribbella soli]|uniref:DUF222 domain-containing protein n=1 Tax=Kribbella soli TaxID=1124743 RepID=A0A4R0HA47_9ACTN|nr:DUF222 domain-containing protein [Kribbella soli]
MELLGERPVWSMSGSELLSTLDALDAEAARRETYRLAVIAAIESTGYATELGARDTAELLPFRYRQDASVARRALRLARALPKYHAVSSALDDNAEDDGSEWLLRPAQAEAIVSALERVPLHVPVADLDAAERELVKLAAHLSPQELRAAGKGDAGHSGHRRTRARGRQGVQPRVADLYPGGSRCEVPRVPRERERRTLSCPDPRRFPSTQDRRRRTRPTLPREAPGRRAVCHPQHRRRGDRHRAEDGSRRGRLRV